MIPNNITQEQVLKAIEEIDRFGVPPRRHSRKYLVEYDGKTYPPKYVLSLANRYANGAELDSSTFFAGDQETNRHLRALGLRVVNKDSGFSSSNGAAAVRRPSSTNIQQPERTAKQTATHKSSSPLERAGAIQDWANVLRRIRWQCWERVVEEDASYRTMERFVEPYTPGGFMTLMVLAGLNDYQTKGKAETGYWPPLVSCLEANEPPTSTGGLGKALEPFFASERFATAKVGRMHRFLRSGLAADLWEMAPARAAAELASIWSRIGETMHQRPSEKTIAFAAKCLAMALVMLQQTDFDFFGVPIPADSRLQELTPSLDDEGIRRFWHAVLVALRGTHPQLTHLHLDTLLWHYLGSGDRLQYLQGIGLTNSEAQEIHKALRGLCANS